MAYATLLYHTCIMIANLLVVYIGVGGSSSLLRATEEQNAPMSSIGTDDETIAALEKMLAQVTQSAEEKKSESQLSLTPSTASTNIQESTSVEKVPSIEQQEGIKEPRNEIQNSVIQSPEQAIIPQGSEIKSIEVETRSLQKQIANEQDNETIGIDTLNLKNDEAQGNWLAKNIWYGRAQDEYEKMRSLVDRIWEQITVFFNKRAELDRTVLDPFFISMGLRLGELQNVLSDLVSRFDLERQKDGELNVQERSLLQNVKEEQLIIEGLNSKVTMVNELNHNIDEALDKLMEQLNKVRAYERDAWSNFKKISQVLSDTKARELYYAIDIQMRNVKDIQKYIQNEFNAYFERTTQRIGQEIQEVKSAIEKLKEQGVDFKMQADVLFESINGAEKKEKQEIHDVKNEHEEPIDVPKDKTYLQRVVYGMKNAVAFLTWPFTYLYKLIF